MVETVTKVGIGLATIGIIGTAGYFLLRKDEGKDDGTVPEEPEDVEVSQPGYDPGPLIQRYSQHDTSIYDPIERFTYTDSVRVRMR